MLSANSLLTDELSAEAMFSVADKLLKKGYRLEVEACTDAPGPVLAEVAAASAFSVHEEMAGVASLEVKAQAVFPPAAVAVAIAEGAGIILVEGSADAVAKLGVVAHLGINLALVAECLANVHAHAEDGAVQMVTCYVHAVGGSEGFVIQASQGKLCVGCYKETVVIFQAVTIFRTCLQAVAFGAAIDAVQLEVVVIRAVAENIVSVGAGLGGVRVVGSEGTAADVTATTGNLQRVVDLVAVHAAAAFDIGEGEAAEVTRFFSVCRSQAFVRIMLEVVADGVGFDLGITAVNTAAADIRIAHLGPHACTLFVKAGDAQALGETLTLVTPQVVVHIVGLDGASLVAGGVFGSRSGVGVLRQIPVGSIAFRSTILAV